MYVFCFYYFDVHCVLFVFITISLSPFLRLSIQFHNRKKFDFVSLERVVFHWPTFRIQQNYEILTRKTDKFGYVFYKKIILKSIISALLL